MDRDSLYNLLNKRYKEFLKKQRKVIKGGFLSNLLIISRGCEILYLGCNSCRAVKSMLDKGARVLSICKNRNRVLKAKKEGFPVLLMDIENIPYINHFHRVIFEDYFYFIESPPIAFEKIVDSLKVGGIASFDLLIEDDNFTFKELILEVLKSKKYNINYPKFLTKEIIFQSIPRHRLKDLTISLKYKIDLMDIQNALKWLQPYLEIVTINLTSDEKKEFQKYIKIALNRRLDEVEIGSILIEYTTLQIEMIKLK